MNDGLQVIWEDDWAVGSHHAEYGEAYEDENGAPVEPDTCETAYVVDTDGNVLASLGCIDGADTAYRAEVESELLAEARAAGPVLPPRKAVTAWEVAPMDENGDAFYVLTIHHGLGRMTRVDLGADEIAGLIASLQAADD